MITRREGGAAVVEIAQQPLQRLDEVAAQRAAQAARRQQHDVVVDLLDQEMIEADLAELVDDHRGVGERGIAQQAVEQRRLAGAEEAGQDGERKRWARRSCGIARRVHCAVRRPAAASVASASRPPWVCGFGLSAGLRVAGLARLRPTSACRAGRFGGVSSALRRRLRLAGLASGLVRDLAPARQPRPGSHRVGGLDGRLAPSPFAACA